MADEYKSIYSGQEVDNAVATAQKALTTDNLVQTTGPSPNNIMSQAATTAAIQNIKAGTTVIVNNVAQTTWNADTKINIFQGTENAGKTFMVGQDGNAVLQTVDTSGGIIQLVGTTSNPINFATSMEVGQLYSCSGEFYTTNTLGLTISFEVALIGDNPPYLIYKPSDTQVLIFNAAFQLSTLNLMIGSLPNSTGSLTFNSSTGVISGYQVNLAITSLNGNIRSDRFTQRDIYAPVTSGTSGQILSSNGDNNDPTWINMPSVVPTTEALTIENTSWTTLSDSSPYTYNATVTLTTTIGTDSIVELINNQPALFATYGFAIGSISGQVATIYSIGQPSTSVTLTVGVTG